MVSESTLYDSINAIAEDYFGPAAPRCMSRIITNHLGKKPERIVRKDIPALTVWVKVTVALLTDDANEVEEFVARLNKLAHRK